ncbi:hypothetical protein FPRO03_14024 [Fusarium proliferatum]|nr:hypothetical protein FPRO03_14024 [Fusarium proliferatum]
MMNTLWDGSELCPRNSAATAMLDQRHADLLKPPNDPNTYTLGSIGKHNIVIACLPKGKIGNNAAATFAVQMVRTFPSIKVGLMVGIGGGIPPKVRLGDVVVSTPVDQYLGVVQWDLGKTEKDGIFKRTGALNNPPSALLTALTKLETNHEMYGSKISQYLDDLKKNWPSLVPKYTRHDSLKDPLFVRDTYYRSCSSWEAICSVLSDMIQALLQFLLGWWAFGPTERGAEQVANSTMSATANGGQRQPGDMRVHYGLIASGNQVIKDAGFRDSLNESLGGGVLCLEMEAAGLMDFPCIVIRGICDYADSQKNKEWQEHAAAVAAAFAKELLECVQPGDVSGERPVKEILSQVLDDTSAIRENTTHTRAKLDRKEDAEILDWLTPIDYGPQQSDYLNRRHPATGNWLLESEEFLGWLATSKQTLLSIEIRASPDDVARYLEGHIEQLPSFVQQDRQLQEEITTGISEAVDGMFLLAQLYLGLLGDKLTLNDLRSAMETFQKQGQGSGEDQKDKVLAGAYEQAMERINGQMPGMKTLAMKVLSWITCAKRQLTTSELQHALAIKTGKSKLDHGDLPHIGDMVSVCAGLVTVDEESGIIRLAHYTTQEYLKRSRERWLRDPESVITTTCVAYLSFIVFETGPCTTDHKFEERLRLNPFYHYAAHNWGHHAPKDKAPSEEVISFLKSKAKVGASIQALMAAKQYSLHSDYSQEAPGKMTGLHLAGYFGVNKAVNTLLSLGNDPDPKDTYSRTPLWYAAQNGHEAVVELLVAAGADVNATAGNVLQTALQAAAARGHLEVVEKLLAARADVNTAATWRYGRTALQAAAEGGYLEVIEKLLVAGADANAAATGYGWTALQVAAARGHLEVVQKLLAAGADANNAAGGCINIDFLPTQTGQ